MNKILRKALGIESDTMKKLDEMERRVKKLAEPNIGDYRTNPVTGEMEVWLSATSGWQTVSPASPIGATSSSSFGTYTTTTSTGGHFAGGGAGGTWATGGSGSTGVTSPTLPLHFDNYMEASKKKRELIKEAFYADEDWYNEEQPFPPREEFIAQQLEQHMPKPKMTTAVDMSVGVYEGDFCTCGLDTEEFGHDWFTHYAKVAVEASDQWDIASMEYVNGTPGEEDIDIEDVDEAVEADNDEL